MRAVSKLLGFVVAIALARPAAAHLGLDYPPSRYGPNVLKEGPCGVPGGLRSNNITVLEPGATIEVTWDEYVDHPGHYRIAFDADGDDDFVDPKCTSGCSSRSPTIELYSNDAVLLDAILDETESMRVTLPDVECERCTLQVIQVMYDKPPYVLPGDDIYYQCADLILRRSVPLPTATATPSATATATPSATATATPASTSTPTSTPTPEASCGTDDTPDCPPACVGDCDGNRAVSVDEIVTMVTIALGDSSASTCAVGDKDGNGLVQVNEIVAALRYSLHGCPQ